MSAEDRQEGAKVEVVYDPRAGQPAVDPGYRETTPAEYRRAAKGAEVKDVHSGTAGHPVGRGIGTVIASNDNTEPAKKRRLRRVRALAYRRHLRRPEGGTEA